MTQPVQLPSPGRANIDDGSPVERAAVPAGVISPVDERNWIGRAVLYGAVPRNFDPPTFAGVAGRLDALRELGIAAIWLAPINPTVPGHFGYEVTEYCDVNPAYGTLADFRALVQAAHDLGIRVLMDFVPNHTSDQHPWFRDAVEHGTESPYWDYYDRDADGNPTHYFNWDHLPNLNFDHPDVRQYMLESFLFWVREFDVDGFRMDAVWGIKQRRPEWLATLTAELKRQKPDCLLIAEAGARDPFYVANGFDAAYDWTEDLGQWAWKDVFTGATPVGEAMIAALTDNGRGYPAGSRVMRFLNNNDTGPRFISTYGSDAYGVALAMLLTLPGLPCLFTGDEAGARYEPYQTPGPIDWIDRGAWFGYTQKLIALRQKTPALYSPDWQPLPVEPATPCFAYARGGEAGETPALVFLNFSEQDVTATVELPSALLTALGDGELIDLWSGRRAPGPIGTTLSLPLPAWEFRILTGGAS